jgi:hypothetical protein
MYYVVFNKIFFRKKIHKDFDEIHKISIFHKFMTSHP